MSRPREPETRKQLLDGAIEEVMEHGIVGRSLWLSTLEPPSPGKCLRHPATPALARPARKASQHGTTVSGPSP